MSKSTNTAKLHADQLTTSAGNPIADNQNALSAGPRGPLLLQDYQLIEKLAHQNRERIPERPVHAKGWGAYGTLTITGDIAKHTKARVLQPGAKTPLILRCLSQIPERSSLQERAAERLRQWEAPPAKAQVNSDGQK